MKPLTSVYEGGGLGSPGLTKTTRTPGLMSRPLRTTDKYPQIRDQSILSVGDRHYALTTVGRFFTLESGGNFRPSWDGRYCC